MQSFGLRLKELRKRNNLTQKQLAERIGVQNTIISFYEVGERKPSLDILIKLSSELHVTTDYLLGIDCKDTLDITGLDLKEKQVLELIVSLLRSEK